MAARPIASAPLTPPVELEHMVARAGLNLNAGQMADLALAWRQIGDLLGRIPRTWSLVDDQAFVFRLPPAVPGSPPTSGGPAVRKVAVRAPRKPRPAKPATGKSPAGTPAKRR